jgi:hypothetical protein
MSPKSPVSLRIKLLQGSSDWAVDSVGKRPDPFNWQEYALLLLIKQGGQFGVC